jgi:hypothetical protein
MDETRERALALSLVGPDPFAATAAEQAGLN